MGAIVVVWQVRDADEAFRQQELRLLAHDARQLAERLHAELRPSEEDLAFLRAMADAGVLDGGVSGEAERFLFERVRSRPGVAGAFMIEPDGGELVMVGRDRDGTRMQSLRRDRDRQDLELHTLAEDFRSVAVEQRPAAELELQARPWYTLAMAGQGLRWTEPYILYPSGLPGITVVAPVIGDAGVVTAMVGITVRLRELGSVMAALPVGEWASLALLTADGQVLAEQRDEVGRLDAATASRALVPALAGGALADGEGTLQITAAEGPRMVAIAPLAPIRGSWLAMVQAPVLSTLELLLARHLTGAIGTVVILVALALAWSWLAWRWLARPLQAARDFAGAQADGQPPRPFVAGPFREVGQLRDDLLSMSHEIGRRREESAELTASLASVNARLERLLEGAPLAVIELVGEGQDFRITRWRGRSAELFGHAAGAIEGRLLSEAGLVAPSEAMQLDDLLQRAARGGPAEAEIPFRTADGLSRVGRWHVAAVEPAAAEPVLLLIVQDDTERKESFEALDRLASRDALTGLPNRRVFLNQAELAILQAERRGELLALWVLDIDDFKGINDGYGHLDGDELLCQFARRIKGLIRGSDLAARLGGDEFVILQTGITHEDQVQAFQNRLHASLAEPYAIAERRLPVSVSSGIAIYPTDAKETGLLMRCADLALLATKREGRAGIARFRSEHAATLAGRREREDRLRAAIAAEALHLAFQPIWEAGSGVKLIGAEALLRWNDEGTEVSPAVFVALAEETGVIQDLGELALRLVCRQLRTWDEEGFGLPISVNLSPAQLRRADLVERFTAILAEHRVDPARVDLEITESLFLESYQAQLQLSQLRQLGFGLAIDDFGTGYANLTSLVNLRPSRLKIDRRFVQSMGGDGRSTTIVRAMVTLAANLGITAVAEGVETREQYDELVRMGCRVLQGFLLGRPVPATELRQAQSSGIAGF